MLIEFSTFQKHSSNSKLSTNIYLLSVATVFRKLQVKVDVTKLHFICTYQRLRSFWLAVTPQKSETFKQTSNQSSIYIYIYKANTRRLYCPSKITLAALFCSLKTWRKLAWDILVHTTLPPYFKKCLIPLSHIKQFVLIRAKRILLSAIGLFSV